MLLVCLKIWACRSGKMMCPVSAMEGAAWWCARWHSAIASPMSVPEVKRRSYSGINVHASRSDPCCLSQRHCHDGCALPPHGGWVGKAYLTHGELMSYKGAAELPQAAHPPEWTKDSAAVWVYAGMSDWHFS